MMVLCVEYFDKNTSILDHQIGCSGKVKFNVVKREKVYESTLKASRNEVTEEKGLTFKRFFKKYKNVCNCPNCRYSKKCRFQGSKSI